MMLPMNKHKHTYGIIKHIRHAIFFIYHIIQYFIEHQHFAISHVVFTIWSHNLCSRRASFQQRNLHNKVYWHTIMIANSCLYFPIV